MSPRLLSPDDAAASIAKRLEASWAERVSAELREEPEAPLEVGLRPGVRGPGDVARIGFGAWDAWHREWKALDLAGIDGATCEPRGIAVSGNWAQAPLRLRVDSLEAGLVILRRLGGRALDVDVARARRIGALLRDAGATLSPPTLRDVCRLPDADVGVAVEAVRWLREHPDLTAFTARQLPVPGMHTKWLSGHGTLLRALTGRDLRTETRPRLSVVHLTYVDPGYLATGGRRHDAWTTGDVHDLAYRPRTVLVVENRDCRLWFPETPATVVVEGGGKAAAAALGGIGWLAGAEHLVYWGDVDSDGFAILDALRAELAPRGVRVDSILMDDLAHARYGHLGVSRDRHGKPLKPSPVRLTNLTEGERACYASVATSGAVGFRRIEQERIPLEDAADALRRIAG